MEQRKSNICDTSTAEREKHRSYDCTFCKRGFTNAQALGGHMNIHRKDKPKSKGNQDNSTRFPQVDLSGHGYNSVFGEHLNYEVYFTTSSNQARNYFPVWRPDSLKDPIAPVEDVDLELRLGQYP